MSNRTAPFILATVLWVASAAPGYGGQLSDAGHVGWIGLFNDDLIGWLENENQLEGLCGRPEPGDVKWEACRAEKLAPKVAVIRLFSDSNERSSSAGSLVVVATPGEGLRAFFAAREGGAAMPFTPDLFDPDFGYGPYFHQTFVDRRGTWFLLPARPFPRGTWFNAANLDSEPELQLLETGDIVTSPRGDLFILAIETGVLRARPQQDADMWCDVNPPPLTPFQELRIPVRQLYDATGHLLLRIKYTRGC